MIDLRDPDARDAAAAEYVLGLLDADDHRTVAEAIARDADLRAAVYAWQDRLLPLSTRAAAAVPGASLWRRIDAEIAANALRVTRPRPTAPRVPWWQRVALWQGFCAAALSVVVALFALLVQQRWEAPAVRYVAVLQSPADQSIGWVVELRADRARLVPAAPGVPVPAGHSLQFWTKPEGAAAPTSLGLVQAGQQAEWPLSDLPAVGAQQLFEITLEPAGGSTVWRPTGPILYVGRTVAL